MFFRGIKISDLQEQDLQKLVDDQVQERDTLEYKRDMYGNSDEDKREMLKDIASLANHNGGHILIGIDEDEEGVATNVVGIESGNHVERIRSSCLDNIDKRIIGLDIEDVPLSSGRVVIIVSIPESINAPHMVTYKGLNQFWKRHGRQKGKMTIDEIGEAFDKRLSNLNRLDRFLFLRKGEILESIGEQTYMVISSSPTYLRDEAIFNINDVNLRDMMLNPPRLAGGMGEISCGVPYPTINGLRADNRTPYETDNPPVRRYIEVFTNGYIEFGILIVRLGENEKYFAGHAHTAAIVNFMRLIETIYYCYLPLTSMVVSFAIYNAKDMWLATSDYPKEDKLVKWQKQHLELGKFYVESISSEKRKLLAKNICDCLWQSFHKRKSNVFDDAGTFQMN